MEYMVVSLDGGHPGIDPRILQSSLLGRLKKETPNLGKAPYRVLGSDLFRNIPESESVAHN